MARGLIHGAQIRAAPRPRYRDCGEYTSKQVRSGGANTVELLISRNVSCPGHLKRGSCARVVLPWGSSECPPSSPRAFFLPECLFLGHPVTCTWVTWRSALGSLLPLFHQRAFFSAATEQASTAAAFFGETPQRVVQDPYRSRTCSATLCGCLIAGWHSQW